MMGLALGCCRLSPVNLRCNVNTVACIHRHVLLLSLSGSVFLSFSSTFIHWQSQLPCSCQHWVRLPAFILFLPSQGCIGMTPTHRHTLAGACPEIQFMHQSLNQNKNRILLDMMSHKDTSLLAVLG